MPTHDSWDGPVRGSRAWWRGLGQAQDDSGPEATERRSRENRNIRWGLVERVRQEIAQGTYDTPEKWDAALDRLLERLDD